MMATTIMISTSVNPSGCEVLLFIPLSFLFWRREPGSRRVIISSNPVHSLPAANRHRIKQAKPRLVVPPLKNNGRARKRGHLENLLQTQNPSLRRLV
jgi:hypothetical protein